MTNEKTFWSGELSFGMVNIPISLSISHKKHDHVFKQYIDLGSGYEPVGRQMIAKESKKVLDTVDQLNIKNGIEVPGLGMVYVDKDKLKELTPEDTKSLKIEKFFKLNTFDFSRLDTTYHVLSSSKDEQHLKAYSILRDALTDSHTGAFVRIKLRHRIQLALIHSHDNRGIQLSTLHYADETIKVPRVVSTWTQAEYKAAMRLIETMTVEDSEYEEEFDQYFHNVTDLILESANEGSES